MTHREHVWCCVFLLRFLEKSCQVLLIDFGSVWFFSTAEHAKHRVHTGNNRATCEHACGASIQSDFLTVIQSSLCHPQRSASCLFMLQKAAAFTSSYSEEAASVRFTYLFILWGCVFGNSLWLPGSMSDHFSWETSWFQCDTSCSIMSEHISAFNGVFFHHTIYIHLLGLLSQLIMRRRTEILLSCCWEVRD